MGKIRRLRVKTAPDGPALDRVVRFLAVMAGLCALASVPASGAFDIRSVAVTGNQAVPAAEIADRSGVQVGAGLFTVDAYRVRERLLRDPRIAAVSVAVSLPDRVRIDVRERRPVAALRAPGGPMLVDRDGVAMLRAAPPAGLPAVTVDRLDLPVLQPGTVVPSADVRLGARLAASLPDRLRPDVGAIRIDRSGEVVLYMRDGIAVRAGSPDGVDRRIAEVPRVLEAVRARRMRVEYVDLRVPGSIVVKPAGSVPGQTGPLAPRQTGQENSTGR